MLWGDGMSRKGVNIDRKSNTADLFKNEDSERILEHPETPCSYVEWRELVPLLTDKSSKHVGNILNWSHENSKMPLGSSRIYFEKNFKGANEETMDDWMYSLSKTPIKDFIDFHIPFMRNYLELSNNLDSSELLRKYLKFYKDDSKGKTVNTFPEKVIIETTKSCNFSCVMCSSRTNGFREDYTLPLFDFGEIIRVFSPYCKVIRINGYGEASIIPDIRKYVDCLNEYDYEGKREIITNLSASYDIYEYLANEDFIIEVSWDAAEKEIFEKIRVGSNYNQMLGTLKKLGDKLSSNPERLILLSTIQESNISQIGPLVDLGDEIGAGMIIFNMVKEKKESKWMKTKFEEIKKEFIDADKRAKNLGFKVKIPDHLNGIPLKISNSTQTSRSYCDRPFKEVQIRWNTELIVCNMFNPYSLGILYRTNIPRKKQNIKKRFKRLWSGPNARLFRDILNTKKRHPYCEKCYYI